MATRARIAVRVSQDTKVGKVELKAGQVIHAYVHSDGYPDSVIPTLSEYYNAEEKAIELISHGDMSSLHASCQKPEGHSFDSRVEGHTVYYGRDRGESDTEFAIGDWNESKNDEEYGYIFENGGWFWNSDYYRTIKILEEDSCYKEFRGSFVEQV